MNNVKRYSSIKTLTRALAASCCAFALMIGSTRAADAKPVAFNIAASDLAEVLNQFGQQSKQQIVFATETTKGKTGGTLHGNYAPLEALDVLLEGSGLTYTVDANHTILVTAAAGQQRGAAGAPPKNPIQTAAAVTRSEAEASRSETSATVEEVVVTGTRIVRDGYEAPTPLTVIAAEDLAKSADSDIIRVVANMPAVVGSLNAAGSRGQNFAGGQGVQSLNLRGIGAGGAPRTLVLLDGQRVGGSAYENTVDVGSFPTALIARVDVVTGGGSAVYGSDAVAGVVNFILERKFAGLKGELSGGVTTYGDYKNYKVSLAAGFGFADERGHMLLSGEHMFNGGILGDGGRKWNREGWINFANPAYTATNGQPQNLVLPQSTSDTATLGGLVVAGPLKGTAFGSGGTPYKFTYGSVVGALITSGAPDWQSNYIQNTSDLEPRQRADRAFLRVSYDLADNINAFVQYGYAQNILNYHQFAVTFPGTATAYLIRNDNAYLPASVKTAMATAGVTSIPIGSLNADMPAIPSSAQRNTTRVSGGLEGSFDAFESAWHWNAYYAYNAVKVTDHQLSLLTSRYTLAIDAVVNPATGQIVCRSTLTNPTNGCKPWNAMGIGVNLANMQGGSFDYLTAGGAWMRGLIEQNAFAASVNGEPFSLWAGPVSIAVSAEHRKDETNGDADPSSMALLRHIGNFPTLHGSLSVTEGALETIVPLAKDESWVRAWDLSAAVRFTEYELSGFVATYKVGSTFTFDDNIRFRITQSRDIRAPTIKDLYATVSGGTLRGGSRDPFRNGELTPPTASTTTAGNPGLNPEKANNFSAGVILSPRFFDGFTMSVDYWRVKITDAIAAVADQQILDGCYQGIASLCPNITRNPDGTVKNVLGFPANLVAQTISGVDLEASYRMPLSQVMSDWRGDFSLHGNMSFYIKNISESPFTFTTDNVGQNLGGLPKWKLAVSATYELDPITATLATHGFSDGVFNNTYIACTSGCPAATTQNPTYNVNFLPGQFYWDFNVDYKVDLGETTTANLFFSVKNIFNVGLPPMTADYRYPLGSNGADGYDPDGTTYRVGIRFKM